MEDRQSPSPRLSSVSDIPNFPARDLVHLREREARQEVSLGVDFTTANRLSTGLYGSRWAVFSTILAWVPWLLALACIGTAIWLSNYWLLVGTALSLLGPLLANPYNPIGRPFKVIGVVVVAGALWFAFTGRSTLAVLLGALALSYWSTWLMYHANQERLRRNALSDEALLLALFQDGKLGIRINESGESLSGRGESPAPPTCA